ncbi:MAG: zf-HC2 domain-containing protein [Gemmatimonadaceae bacterium]|nr:zf-HC2 domain-containing protein [Gemmatimonadaceae bacterium]
MTDCQNVEVRELLPELLHDALPASERERVEAHVAACELCAAEFALLRDARHAMARLRVPAIDTARIVAALPRTQGARSDAAPGAAMPSAATPGGLRLHRTERIVAAQAPVARRRTSVLYRIAAAVTFISLGGMSLTIARSYFSGSPAATADSAMSQESALQSAPRLAVADTPAVPGAGSGITTRGLTVHSALAELDDASLESLITELDQLEAAPLAEPEGTPGSRLIASTPSSSQE